MLVEGKPYRTVWADPAAAAVRIIDQRHLPWSFAIEDLPTVSSVATAIKDMHVRGAGCIGSTAGYGMWLAAREAQGDQPTLRALANELVNTRPTASNLAWAVNRQLAMLEQSDPATWEASALEEANAIADEDAAWCEQIGAHGLKFIQGIAQTKPGTADAAPQPGSAAAE